MYFNEKLIMELNSRVSKKDYYETKQANSNLIEPSFNIIISEENNEDIEDVSLTNILAAEEELPILENTNKNIQHNFLAEDGAVKKALAEISFIEANETLEKGDLQSAIAKYKEAISYFPNDAGYYLRLIDVFNKDPKYKTELDLLLKEIAEKFPNDAKVKSKLEELNPQLKTKPIDKSINNNEMGKDAIAKLLRNIDESEPTKNLTQSLRSNARTEITISKPTNKVSRVKKLKNNVYVLAEGAKKQKPYIQVITAIFLIVLPIAILFGLNRTYKETIIETIPVAPEAQSNLAINQLYFCWTSNTDKTDYLLQIEQEGKPVLERYTREKFYLVSQEDAESIKENVYCTWRAIPISPKRESLKYKTIEGQFMLVK